MPADRLSEEQIADDLQICADAMLETWHPENWDVVTLSWLKQPNNAGIPFIKAAIRDFPSALEQLLATRKALADKLAAVRRLAEAWEQEAAADGEISAEAVEFLTDHAARLREIGGESC